MKTFELGLVLPCYNYGRRLRQTLERINHWRQAVNLSVMLCIVDDGSSDDTLVVAQEFQKEHADWCLVHACSSNRGKGRAIREGAARLDARLPFVFFTDADLHYGLDVISDRMLPQLKAGADVVTLDRSWNRQFHSGSFLRRTLSYAFTHLKSVLARVPLDDSQAGMKGFRGEFFRNAVSLSRVDGFAFDVELLSMAVQYRYRIEQIPILIKGEAAHEGSSMTAGRAIRMLWDLLRVAVCRYSGRYDSQVFTDRIAGQVYEIAKHDK